jgi:predicted dehydrogenase
MLKVAIVGCGKIADAHASQIRRIRGCEIVAACDREPLMAKQFCDRFGVARHFGDVADLLRDARPDVVHVTTPPASHFGIARQCLERGVHVYVEKPFTLDADEAGELLVLATRSNVQITAGHDDQFSHAARRMRALVESGYLGGRPVHMESTYCYDLSEPGYAKALLGDRRHWVRGLPGGLLQNIISHGIARIAEFLSTDSPHVIAHGFVSQLLRSIGEKDIVDELRVIIADGGRTTASFTFSSQMRPSIHEFRIYGPKNGLVLDQDHETVIALRGARFKSYADKFLPPLIVARQHVGNVITNARTFLARDFQMKSGMKYLIESFYRSIAGEAAPPIPYRQILLTARIMDDIFNQLARPALQERSRSEELLTS